MAIVELTISPRYQRDEWNIWEALREIVSNAQDAQSVGSNGNGRMDVVYRPDKERLDVRTWGVKLPLSVLLMGEGDKHGDSRTIGTFGEGLPMAMMTLARLRGLSMEVINGDEKWKPSIRYSDKFQTEVVAISTRQLKEDRGYFEVSILGLGSEMWNELRERFLFLDPKRLETKKCVVEINGVSQEILLDPRHQNMLFVKGVYITHRTDLRYGYNLNLPLNRDRSMIGEWDLRYLLGNVIKAAAKQYPEDMAADVMKILEQGTGAEVVDDYSFRHDEAFSKIAAEHFIAEHGEDAFPVTSVSESKELAHFGKNGVVVSKSLAAAVEVTLGSFDKHKMVLDRKIEERLSWNDLTAPERDMLEWCDATIKKSNYGPEFSLLDVCEVVVFTEGSNLLGLFENGRMSIARGMLAEKVSALSVVVHELSHGVLMPHTTDGSEEHASNSEAIYCSIIANIGG